MIGYVVNGKLDHMDVNGNGQTLYYAREKEEIIGMNRAESSNISIRFKNGKIYRIVFLKQPEGELNPLQKLNQSDEKLSNFNWYINLRPLSKTDIFRTPKVADEEDKKKTLQP